MAGSDWDDDSDSGAAAPPPVRVPVTASKKFADEDASDDDVKDEWDASDDEEAVKPKAPTGPPPPSRNKGITKQKIAEKEAADAAAREAEEELRNDTPHARKAREHAAALAADMEHASALLGSSSLSKDSLLSMPISTKDEAEAAAAAIADALVRSNGSKPFYNLFVQALVKAVAAPLRDVEVRKAASGLSTLANEIQQAQRDAASGKKKKGASKPGLSVGGKVAAPAADTRAYVEAMDDDYDDDFM